MKAVKVVLIAMAVFSIITQTEARSNKLEQKLVRPTNMNARGFKRLSKAHIGKRVKAFQKEIGLKGLIADKEVNGHTVRYVIEYRRFDEVILKQIHEINRATMKYVRDNNFKDGWEDYKKILNGVKQIEVKSNQNHSSSTQINNSTSVENNIENNTAVNVETGEEDAD